MFKLQRLEISGFKSFADHTEIVFTGNGITAVVGPNGCGKSNVSDCISWVLGEQRARSLRGGEMKDVIFQGSKNRKPGGMAEVTLHLVRDNEFVGISDDDLEEIDETLNALDERAVDLSEIEDGQVQAPEIVELDVADNESSEQDYLVESAQAAQVGTSHSIERTVRTKRHWKPRSVALNFVPGEAVSVTRRLYMSGESDYQLNGKTCRLRDIQDLFAGTGLSGAHYAIIEQGRIGQILSAKPSDRRGLLEEAAGISKFRTRQRAAESRLESAKTNLGRISDIVSEVDKQANSLRRQAAKTRRYITLQEEYRVRLKELFVKEQTALSNDIERIKEALSSAHTVEAELAKNLRITEEEFHAATDNARISEEALAQVRRLHSEQALDRDRSIREHKYQSEQASELTKRVEILTAENSAIVERLGVSDSEIERLRKEEEKEAELADASRELLSDAEKKWSEKIEVVKIVEQKLETERGMMIKHLSVIERSDELQRQLDLNLQRLRVRSSELENERKRVEQSITEYSKESERISGEVIGEKKRLETLNSEKRDVMETLSSIREKLSASESALKEFQQQYSRNLHRLETLEELEEKKAVYDPQIQRLFSSREQIGINIAGVLADFLVVDETVEESVEELFGGHLQTVIVRSGSDATKLWEWASEHGKGRISILVVDEALDISPAASENITDRLGDRLGVSKALKEILDEVFPREMSARLTESISGLGKIANEVLVDGKASIAIGKRFLSGGSRSTNEKNTSLLAFKRELSGLSKAVEKIKKDVQKADSVLQDDRSSLQTYEEKVVDLQSLIIKIERELVGLEVQETSALQEIERADRHLKVIQDEMRQTVDEIGQIESRLESVTAAAESAKELYAGASAEMERISAELQLSRSASDKINEELNEKRTIAATSGERRRSVQFALRRLENERNELQLRLDAQRQEYKESKDKIGRLSDSIKAIEKHIASFDKLSSVEQEELSAALKTVQDAREKADTSSRRLAELNKESSEAINGRSLIEVKQAEVITQLNNLRERCWQELNLPFEDLTADEDAGEIVDLEVLRRIVADQRERLDGFGGINMLAVDELREAEERLDFLTSQRQDIIDSIVSAEEALREIKIRSRQKFKEAFEAVNVNFTEIFHELFGGGRGEMMLLESEDILESGIEIVAQPPGKRLQNILLLSGGEKAMTAIALVLAIFRYRPSPFCLLDEVDAPLDEANVGRFVGKISEMSEKTQFIVITHNKRTMEAARALYGVTMEEPGVSRVVSVKFE